MQVVELTNRRADALGHAVEFQLNFGDDAKRAFGANIEAREIVSGA